MSTQQVAAIQIFGSPKGAAGIRVTERVGVNRLRQPNFGAVVIVGSFKRGPAGVPVPVSSREQYDLIFGDPRDTRWHLFADNSQSAPDAVDGYFTMAGQSGSALIVRLDLDNKGKKAIREVTNRFGTKVLRFTAANVGRWGGVKANIPFTPVVVSTARTFTINAPGVETNQFVGAKVSFSNGSGKVYDIVSNTASFDSGEVIFTISPQYDLVQDGISGPAILTGLANYSQQVTIAGTVSFSRLQDLTGTISLNGNVLTGVGTAFTTELSEGDNVYYLGDVRKVASITSNTTLTLDSGFGLVVTNGTFQRDNVSLVGTATDFTTLSPGDLIYVVEDGKSYARKIAAIASATSLTLETGYPFAVTAGTQASVDNYWVKSVGASGANYDAELSIGDNIIDPNRTGSAVKVVEIDTIANRFKISQQFSKDFSNAEITKQSQSAKIDLERQGVEGLSVEIGLGIKFPQTYFSVNIYFNGSQVMRIPDASLDPNDPLFIETLVNDANVAHRTSGETYHTWVTCESLWNGIYTTAASNDVRPVNGAGEVLAVSNRRVYTVADFDYSSSINAPFYPNPYKFARDLMRIKGAAAPVVLEGSCTSEGTLVTGTNTNFTAALKKGDYLYNPVTNEAISVRLVTNDGSLLLDAAFSSDMPAGTICKKAGYLQFEEGTDMTKISYKGDRFIVSFREYFTGGYDGDLGTILPYHYTKFFNVDKDLIGQAIYGRNLGLVRIICPGVSSVSVQSQGGNYASQIACEFRVEFPPHVNTAASAEAFINLDLGRDNFFSAAFPSHALIANPLSSGKRFVPINGDILGLESVVAVLHQGWHYPASGLDARLNRVEELLVDISPSDQATLNNAGIQPIVRMLGRVVIFGAETPAVDPMYQFLHVRRIQSNMVRFFLESLPLLRSLFKPNNPNLAASLYLLLRDYFQAEYAKGVFNQYLSFEEAVTISIDSPNGGTRDQTSSQDALVAITNGDLRAYISYIPTGILKNFDINLGPDIITASYGQYN